MIGRSYEVVTPKGIVRYKSADDAITGAVWLGLTYKPQEVYAQERYWLKTTWLGGTKRRKPKEGEDPNRVALYILGYALFVATIVFTAYRLSH